MAEIGLTNWRMAVAVISIVAASMLTSANKIGLKADLAGVVAADMAGDMQFGYFGKLENYLFQENESGYQHVWPEMKFGWKIVLGSFFGFCGAAFGSVGGIGGGGIFVPMLTLIIGFDAKSATAVSKCMIMGAAASSVYYNLKLRHPTLDMPIIDYDLAVLIQPMLMLGISIGVSLNVIFADWMVTILLIILCIGTSTKAFCRGVDTWKKETNMKKEVAMCLEPNGENEVDRKLIPSSSKNETKAEESIKQEVPISCGVSGYEAISLYNGSRKISSKADSNTNLRVGQLILYCSCGVFAGMVAGLLGIGGGSILGTLFFELGIPPQASTATAIFAMMFSSSMSVVEYYLLNRFPVPYAFYFVVVATISAFVGQHVARRIVIIMGRASIIIFILAFTVFVSAISLGGVGILNMIDKSQRHEYMGFENLCKYEV